MKIKGTVWKDGRWWLIEFPLLDAMTQGKTRKEALAMGADWVESDMNRSDFKAEVTYEGHGVVSLTCNDDTALIALVLRQQREKSGLTLEQVAERLGSSSVNAYARYEQGKTRPSLEKLDELLHAVDGELALSI